MPFLRRYPLAILLIFAVIAVGLRFTAPERTTLILSLPSWASFHSPGSWGRRPKRSAERLGGGIGGLLNATFGNAAELIIAAQALRRPPRSCQSVAQRDRSSATCCCLRRRRIVVAQIPSVQNFNRTASRTARQC